MTDWADELALLLDFGDWDGKAWQPGAATLIRERCVPREHHAQVMKDASEILELNEVLKKTAWSGHVAASIVGCVLGFFSGWLVR